MKKLLFFITCLFLLTSLQGQILRYSNYVSPSSPDTLGTEMIYNGSLDDDSHWTVGSVNIVISGGVASFNDLVSTNLVQSAANMVSPIALSTTYYISFTISITSGSANFRISNAVQGILYVDYANYANGSHGFEFTTPSDIGLGGISFRLSTDSSNAFTIDNISLREVL